MLRQEKAVTDKLSLMETGVNETDVAKPVVASHPFGKFGKSAYSLRQSCVNRCQRLVCKDKVTPSSP